ncbi:efflux RND transporter periplasmic adaptor subunit [Leptolyngbya sp. NK1-12]|uniref:Efflux RND transporter periplasmic adaptor subunit n=1 Tax=Leptolyngbya sp. NK1-12 TaxID=2547451 RepID=A0AA97AJI7_9CYAN|nr:efflux RND transporter periplasmic adaptor subunit [Leptolyngbya sp. NK1-12]WNZ24961.1 efflux RND transporter periplasmic adaptor subunit [Leptolyngbya sp. NK1-12]
MITRLSEHFPKHLLSTVLLSVSLVGGCSQPDSSQQASAPTAVPVQWQKIEPGRVQEMSEFVGTLQAAEIVEVRPEVQGQIQDILVQPGDRVGRGTPIMTLRPDQTMPQLQGATATLQSARASRETAVRQRKVALAQVATAESDVALAQTNYERATYLVGQGAIGAYQFDQAENNLEAARNRLTTAREQLRVAEVQIAQSESRVKETQAQVDAARVSVNFRQILSPLSGIVGDIAVKAGDVVTTGQTITTITQNAALDLRLSVPANRLPDLRAGLPVELLDPNNKQKIATGTINFVSPNVNTQAQSVLVKARFSNQDGQLRNGQFVRARVIWAQNPGILIPMTAVTRTGAQGFVYVITTSEDGTESAQPIVEQRPVKLGTLQGDQYEVLNGIEAGEQIATSNILRLRNGAPVQPQS